jgi:hypothetical protein
MNEFSLGVLKGGVFIMVHYLGLRCGSDSISWSPFGPAVVSESVQSANTRAGGLKYMVSHLHGLASGQWGHFPSFRYLVG